MNNGALDAPGRMVVAQLSETTNGTYLGRLDGVAASYFYLWQCAS